ncbi:polysaccharide deacetylase family protein [Actinomycetes bacterium KLBMP 9759]
MRRILVVLGALVVLVPAVGWGVLRVASSPTFQFFGELTPRVETDARVVALTFDDGPDPAGTQPMLDALAAKGVPGTFYLVGAAMQQHPELARAIVAAGHELGNHTFTHTRMMFVSPGFVAREVERTDEQIRAAGYTGEITFRPPNGKKLLALPYYLQQHGRRTVTWDVEPLDGLAADAPADAITRYVVERVRPGSIVLLHGMYQGREQARAAIGPIVDELRGRGYTFVTVSQLLARAPGRAD